jgi:GTP-binding protein Era
MLKRVGTEARKELEALLGTKIYLELFVKVVPGWRDDPSKVRDLDWHSQLEGLAQNQRTNNDENED